MGWKKEFFSNTGRPLGLSGRLMVSCMNRGHAAVSDWGLSHLPESSASAIADLGCGGGRNAAVLLDRYPDAFVTALDYSPVSVNRTRRVNRAAVEQRRCRVLQGNVASLPLKSGQYDLVTAFETIYFWPGPVDSFREVKRILKPGGSFLIVNEADGTSEKDARWTQVVEGMRLWTPEQVCRFLHQAGFGRVTVFRRRKHRWIAFLAEKI